MGTHVLIGSGLHQPLAIWITIELFNYAVVRSIDMWHPTSACRGPGELEAVLVMEHVVDSVAAHLALPGHVVREVNMMKAVEGMLSN
jgi:hypothetical protein